VDAMRIRCIRKENMKPKRPTWGVCQGSPPGTDEAGTSNPNLGDFTMSVTIQISGTTECQMNLTNRNFCTLWIALGLEPETADGLVGQVDARVVLHRMATTPIGMVVFESWSNIGPEGPELTFFEVGISEDQVRTYFQLLKRLADLAEKREDPILWY